MVEKLEGQDTYITNLANNLYLPNGTSSATVNFRIWLLNDDDVETVVTLDTEGIDYQADGDLSNLYQKELVVGWNWFSLNVQMDNMTLDDVFSNTLVQDQDPIKNQITQSIYYDGYGFYPNFDMNVVNHYQFNSSLGGDILYYGDYLEPSENPLTIVSGWNWIGFCPPYPLDVNAATASLSLQDQDYIKNNLFSAIYYDGYGWYPAFTMQPTEGYMLDIVNPGTLIYPDESLSEDSEIILSRSFNDDVWYLDRHFYEYNASMVLDIDIENTEVSENDQIGAFYGNECRGIGFADLCPITDEYVFNTMIYSNTENEIITFKYYNAETGEIYPVENTYLFEKDTNLGTAIDPYVLTDELLPTETGIKSIYPNPFNPQTTISYSLEDDVDNISINIYDITGRKIETLIDRNQLSGLYSINWNASNLSSGIYIVKMNVDGIYLDSYKLTLIK